MWWILFSGVSIVIAATLYNGKEDVLPEMLRLPKDSLARVTPGHTLPDRWSLSETSGVFVVSLSANERLPGPGSPIKLIWQCSEGRLSLAMDSLLPLSAGKPSADYPSYAPVSVGISMTGVTPYLSTWWRPLDGGSPSRVFYSNALSLSQEMAERLVGVSVRYASTLGEKTFTFDARGLGIVKGHLKGCF